MAPSPYPLAAVLADAAARSANGSRPVGGPFDLCWLCQAPRRARVRYEYVARLGIECERCTALLATPLSDLERAAFDAFHHQAATQRAAARAAA